MSLGPTIGYADLIRCIQAGIPEDEAASILGFEQRKDPKRDETQHDEQNELQGDGQ